MIKNYLFITFLLFFNLTYSQDTPCNQDPGTETGDTGCVTFTYNGVETTYTTVRSADGNIWIQQNLGSQSVATSGTDTNAYGDLFQWGRWDDGHQLRTSTVSSTVANPNNPLGIQNGDNKFYYSDPEWWDGGSVTNTWKASVPENVTAENGCDPCKALGQGWRLPSQAEWAAVITAENATTIALAFQSNLKLTVAGSRGSSLSGVGVRGYYWSSTVSADNASFSKYLYMGTTLINPNAGGFREQGSSVRCLKDFTDYCAVSVDFDVEPITSVSFGDFNNQTSEVVNATPAYEDFTTISTDVEKGETYNLAVKGNTVGQFEHDIRIFFDWNQDQVFDMDTEYYTVSLLPSTGTDNVTASIDITIPTDAALGTTRMRIIKDQWNTYEEGEFDACLNAYYGQVEDYTINVIGQIIDNPVTAINITTENNVDQTIETEAGTLQLIATATPAVANQEVNWSITSGSTFATIDNNGLVTALENGTATIRATSTEDNTMFDEIEVTINTPEETGYCTPEFFYPSSAAGITLNEISLAGETITWNVNPVAYNENGYADYTNSQSVDLISGNGYALNFHTNWENPNFINVRAWIDYNQNNQFDDNDNEEIGYVINGIDASGNGVFNFTVPENTPVGIYRLRAILQFPNAVPDNLTPCGTINSYGIAVDYNLSIQENLNVTPFEKNNVKLYPNPTSDFVNIQTDEVIKSINVFNQLGQLIITQKDSKINLSDASTGIYMVHVTLENDTTHTQKIIKK